MNNLSKTTYDALLYKYRVFQLVQKYRRRQPYIDMCTHKTYQNRTKAKQRRDIESP